MISLAVLSIGFHPRSQLHSGLVRVSFRVVRATRVLKRLGGILGSAMLPGLRSKASRNFLVKRSPGHTDGNSLVGGGGG